MNLKLNRSDLVFVIASISIALLLWLKVQSQVDPHLVREYSIPLETRSLKEGLAIAHAPSYVTVVAEGTESDLNQISLDRLKAYVDLSEAKVGQKDYPVKFINLSRTNATLTLRHPKEIIAIEKLVSKEINVIVEEQGLPTAGLLYAGSIVSPSTATLEGPETQVSQVVKARALLNLSNLRPGNLVPTIIEVLGDKNQQIPMVYAKPPVVMINPFVTPAPASKSVLINPIWRGKVLFGYKVTNYEVKPSQVQIKGKSSILAQINTVDTEPISIEGISKDTSFTVSLQIPPEVEIVGNNRVYVTLHVSPVSSTDEERHTSTR
jgi:YbbR domain-containing protein